VTLKRAVLIAGLAVAGLAALVVLFLRRSDAAAPVAIPVRVIVGDILSHNPEWEVVRAHPKYPPSVRVITPSDDYRLDGADMPALVLPPPAEVRFRVPDDAGEVSFIARAGLRSERLQGEEPLGQGGKLSLSVFVDGASVFEKSVPVGPGSKCAAGSTSRGPEGLKLSGGQEVVLKSALTGPDGKELPSPRRWSPASAGASWSRPAGARARRPRPSARTSC
jgi:hypothetical protein